MANEDLHSEVVRWYEVLNREDWTMKRAIQPVRSLWLKFTATQAWVARRQQSEIRTPHSEFRIPHSLTV
jgi:hypothetical protein